MSATLFGQGTIIVARLTLAGVAAFLSVVGAPAFALVVLTSPLIPFFPEVPVSLAVATSTTAWVTLGAPCAVICFIVLPLVACCASRSDWLRMPCLLLVSSLSWWAWAFLGYENSAMAIVAGVLGTIPGSVFALCTRDLWEQTHEISM